MMQSQGKVINLQIPNLSPDNLIQKIQFRRAFRKGGPRVQKDNIQGKHIFHNYGHGGAAFSHAYGSSYLAAKSIVIEVGSTRALQAAVLGSGFLGLMTALQLAKRSYSVTIYSERIPELGHRSDSFISSEVDPGKWFPYLCDEGTNPLRHEVLSKLSYDYYKDCIETKKYRSISFIDCYDNHLSSDTLKQIAPPFIVGDYSDIKLNINDKSENFVEFKSLSVDSALLLQELIVEAMLRGVKFVQKKFEGVEDVVALKENMIMNCLGFGAAKVFKDDKVTPITGYLLVYKNPTKINYVLSTKHEGQQFSVYGIRDKLIVGNYTRNSKGKEEEFQNLENKAKSYFQPKPKL